MVAGSVAFTMCPHLCSQFYMPAVPKETWTHFPTLGASASVCPSFLFLDQNLGGAWRSLVLNMPPVLGHLSTLETCSFVSLPCSGIPIESSLLEDAALLPKPHPSWMLSEEPSGPHYTHRQPFPEQSTAPRSFFSHELQCCVQFLLFWSLAFLLSAACCTTRLHSITQPPQTPPDLLLHCPTRALVCQSHLFLVFPTTQLLIDQTSFILGNLYSLWASSTSHLCSWLWIPAPRFPTSTFIIVLCPHLVWAPKGGSQNVDLVAPALLPVSAHGLCKVKLTLSSGHVPACRRSSLTCESDVLLKSV